MPRRKDEIRAREWFVVLYPESMLPDWTDKIYDVLQCPFAYCIHYLDRDMKSEHRKTHVHLLLHFEDQKTERQVFKLVNRLALLGKNCAAPISDREVVIDIRHCYDYLIHNTESCKRTGKELYPTTSRIEGNNFDIGMYEKLSEVEKEEIILDLKWFILDKVITNFRLFEILVSREERFQNLDQKLLSQILRGNSNYFNMLIKGNYLHVSDQTKKSDNN